MKESGVPHSREIRTAFHRRAAEPINPSIVFEDLRGKQVPEVNFRGEMWHMFRDGELVLRKDRRVQNGVDFTRQLSFPGWDEENDRLTTIYEQTRNNNTNR